MMGQLPLQGRTRRTGEGTLEADGYIVAARFGVAAGRNSAAADQRTSSCQSTPLRAPVAAGRTAYAAAAPIIVRPTANHPLRASVGSWTYG
jgi:hypothetical protein